MVRSRACWMRKKRLETTFCFSEGSVEVQAPFELVLHHWSRANLFPKDIIYLTKSWVPATPRQYEERRMAKNDNKYKVAMACVGMLLKSVVYFICFMLTWRSCFRVKYIWNEARLLVNKRTCHTSRDDIDHRPRGHSWFIRNLRANNSLSSLHWF